MLRQDHYAYVIIYIDFLSLILPTKKLSSKNPMSNVSIPNRCEMEGQAVKPCGPSPYVVMADYCEFIDQQTLKLQENPEAVPTGEMPRNIVLSTDRCGPFVRRSTEQI